ncbi:cyclase family protein [Schlesneria sp. DSM 10557]|uniref:cyclase family protein n=1 Tax=Schlesneria sp. DSM 10557 TaxID=3044399 RepID=UPI0035A12F2A
MSSLRQRYLPLFLRAMGWWLIATGITSAQNRPAPVDSVQAVTLGQLAAGEAELLDLTHSLDEKSPFWPGDDYQPFELKTIATLEKNGVSSKAFSMPEHFGTHIDAPCHFERGQLTLDEIASEDLFAPGVVVDISLKGESDADYRLTVADLTDWETIHGPIPRRAIVLLNTGWARFWKSNVRYRNQDAQGRMHFPGFSAEAASWLIKERNIRGIGIDTLSIDYGPSKDFTVHHQINGAGRYGLENVANLDQLPARNFFLIVAPIKITSGTGGPTRMFAIQPRTSK